MQTEVRRETDIQRSRPSGLSGALAVTVVLAAAMLSADAQAEVLTPHAVTQHLVSPHVVTPPAPTPPPSPGPAPANALPAPGPTSAVGSPQIVVGCWRGQPACEEEEILQEKRQQKAEEERALALEERRKSEEEVRKRVNDYWLNKERERTRNLSWNAIGHMLCPLWIALDGVIRREAQVVEIDHNGNVNVIDNELFFHSCITTVSP